MIFYSASGEWSKPFSVPVGLDVSGFHFFPAEHDK